MRQYVGNLVTCLINTRLRSGMCPVVLLRDGFLIQPQSPQRTHKDRREIIFMGKVETKGQTLRELCENLGALCGYPSFNSFGISQTGIGTILCLLRLWYPS